MIVDRADGPWVWDQSGRRYLDFIQGHGTSILGHGNNTVVDAASRALATGVGQGCVTSSFGELTQMILQRVNCESAVLVASEQCAMELAINVARKATSRTKVVNVDAATASSSFSPGSIDEQVACVVVEPIPTRTGLVAPDVDALRDIREACSQAGAVLVFDETLSGFRVHRGGASVLLDVRPDLWCFGRVLGDISQLSAVATGSHLFEQLSECHVALGPNALAHPIAVAAAVATLQQLDEGAYTMLSGRADDMKRVMEKAFADAGVDCEVTRCASLLGLRFDVDGRVGYQAFQQELQRRGVLIPENSLGVLLPSLAHTWDDLERMGDAVTNALSVL